MVNRQQRRANRKQDTGAISAAGQPAGGRALADEALPPPERKPGLALRIVAAVLLSPILLGRVRHPQLLAALREIARQAGNERAWRRIGARLDTTSR